MLRPPRRIRTPGPGRPKVHVWEEEERGSPLALQGGKSELYRSKEGGIRRCALDEKRVSLEVGHRGGLSREGVEPLKRGPGRIVRERREKGN